MAVWMRGILGILLIPAMICSSGLLVAQVEAEAAAGTAAERLQQLDEQRRLWRVYRAESAPSRDPLAAAGALASMSQLKTLVPLPFVKARDPRAFIAKKMSSLLSGAAKTDQRLALTETRRLMGRACNRCKTSGVTRCVLCRGAGYIEKRRRRKTTKVECRAWDVCSSCTGMGRLGVPARTRTWLGKLHEAVRRGATETDALGALRKVFGAVGSNPLRVDRPQTKVLPFHKAIGRAPFLPERLSGGAKKRLKMEWAASSPAARRDFLHLVALDMADFVRDIEFLSSVEDTPSLQQVVNSSTRLTWSELESQVPLWVGKTVSVTVTGAETTKDWPAQSPLKLQGALPTQEAHPTILMPFFWTVEDLARVRALPKLVKGFKADRHLRKYPPSAVSKSLKKIGPSKPLQLTGRVLRGRPGQPLYLLEIWKVEIPSANGGGR